MSATVIGKYIDELDQKLDPNAQPSQPENKNIGQEDLQTSGRMVEQKLQQAGQKIEELGHQTDQKLESLGGKAEEATTPKTRPRAGGVAGKSPDWTSWMAGRNGLHWKGQVGHLARSRLMNFFARRVDALSVWAIFFTGRKRVATDDGIEVATSQFSHLFPGKISLSDRT